MLAYTGKLFAIGCICLAFTAIGNAQSACPQDLVCLTRPEANVAASNAREVVALRKEVEVLKDGLTQKDESIRQLKEANDKNTADLKNQLNKVTVDYATAQGQLIGAEATVTRQTAIIDVLLKYTRKKCLPLSVCIN